MTDLKSEGPPRDLQLRRHRDSRTMLAIIMSGLAALFVLAIVAAYNAAHTNVADKPATTTTSSRAPAAPAETTGAGSSERRAAQPRTPRG